MTKLRWGVLGAATIATVKVIPGMQRSAECEIAAIASRDRAKAEEAARALHIPKAYGSYDELLADPEIDAVYNPLPNHLHVPWSIRAAEAGKHVLCEKPLGMNTGEVRELIAARDRTGVTIGEAFMVQVHPLVERRSQPVRTGRIGPLRFAMVSYGYYNDKPENIRNIAAYGGGGLMDIGCYPIKVSRMVFAKSPCAWRPPCGATQRWASTSSPRRSSITPPGRAIFPAAPRWFRTRPCSSSGRGAASSWRFPSMPFPTNVRAS